jgi:hypothetical protein
MILRAAAQIAMSYAFLPTYAHEHHPELSEEENDAPIDTLLWLHVAIQATVWGVLFPIGMVLGITRSRWHVPLQAGSCREAHTLLTYMQIRRSPPDLPSQLRVFLGPFAPWPPVLGRYPRFLRLRPLDTNGRATHTGNLLEASHTREFAEAFRCSDARLAGKVLPTLCMGADIVRHDHHWRVLS